MLDFFPSISQKYVLYCAQIEQVSDPLLINWTECKNVSSTERWVLVDNLKAAAAFQFRVSAENSVGVGPSSVPSNIVVLPQERK